MFEPKKLMHFMIINPSGGFNVSKNYIIDLQKPELIDTRTKQHLPYNLDSKILVYEDRQKTWFFEIAESLKSNNEAGFVILMIAIAYLESNQQYRSGISSTHQSTKYIQEALDRLFGNKINPELKTMFSDGVRNGLFHDGITKKGIFINASQDSIFEKHDNALNVNPHKFLDIVKIDFESYMVILKDSNNILERSNFEKLWDSQKGI